MKKRPIILLIICVVVDCLVSGITAGFAGTNASYLVSLWEIIRRNAFSLYSVISIAFGALDYLLPFFGKDLPKVKSAEAATVFFSIVFCYRCISDIFINLECKKNAGSVFVAIIFLIFYVYSFMSRQEMKTESDSDSNEDSSSERALTRYVKRKIGDCHQAITSIQLHKVVRSEDHGQIYYSIDYSDSGRKSAIYPNDSLNINAVLDTRLEISVKHFDFFQPFLEAYNNYLKAESVAEQAPYISTMKALSREAISALKGELNSHIQSVADITISDCCIARLILVYLSCLAQIGVENADDYVGIRCESLNIGEADPANPSSKQNAIDQERENVNKQLFSKFRTGFLGALLLKNCPYVFYYEQEHNSTKANRRYVSFVLDHEGAKNVYLVLMTVNVPKDSDRFYASLLRAIRAIHQDCDKIYMKHEVK